MAAGGGEGVVPVCVCALFMGHIGYISLKTKNIIFFFIIKVFAKTRNYKRKKKCLFQLCTPKLRCLCSVFLQAAAYSPRLGSFSGPHLGKLYPGGSFWTSNLRVVPANIQQIISAHLALGSGSKQGPNVSAETGTHLKFGTKS